MALHFESPSQGRIDYLLQYGWTPEEISMYVTQVELLSDTDLLRLHGLCGITMYKSGETVDRTQAIRVLINPKDTPKHLLISSLRELML